MRELLQKFATEGVTILFAMLPGNLGCSSNSGSNGGATQNSGFQFDASVKVTGVPCSSMSEDDPGFSSFATNQTEYESQPNMNPGCPGEICLVHEFQGRASCPYGQTQQDLSLPGTSPRRCRTPGGTPVTVPVAPQLIDRSAARYSICSCRCGAADNVDAGSGGNPAYCACPAGMVCQPVIPLSPFMDATTLSGSYCVWPDSGVASISTCSIDDTNPATLCGSTRANP